MDGNINLMRNFLLICLGSAFGGGARYLISAWALSRFGTGFAYGTLIVNVVGSFLISAIMHIGLTTEIISPAVRIALTMGVIGGFTTYSSFNYETTQYLQSGEIFKAMANILIMAFSCLIAGFVGLLLAKRLVG